MGGMNTERPNPEYGCGQQDLYTVCATIAISYVQHVSDFTDYSTNYTATTGADLRSVVTAARELPDEAKRDAEHSLMRKQLVNLKDGCLIEWQQLTSYIRDAFGKELYADQLNAAGHGYYAKAQNEDWDDVNGLMTNASLYVVENMAALTDDGGMVAGFSAALEAAKDAFETKHSAFLQSLENAKDVRDAKIDANNAVYRETMRICKDGKRIFRQQASVREQFTFDVVLGLVTKNRQKHGVSGVVKNAADGVVVGQVSVFLDRLLEDGTYDEVEELLTDNEGYFKFLTVNGSYRVLASKVGFVNKEVAVLVDGGLVVLDVEMGAEV
jgi:hypothetical protein